MTIIKEDIRALHALLDTHYKYWLDTDHCDGVAIRANSGCVRSGTDITRLLAGLWNDLGYSTIPLKETARELLRVRCGVVNNAARFDLVYSRVRDNGTVYTCNLLTTGAPDAECEIISIQTKAMQSYVRTKKINLLVTMLERFNSQKLNVQQRGQVSLIR